MKEGAKMFGAIYLFGELIKSTIIDIKNCHENNLCKKRNVVDNRGLTYIDNKGVHRFISNDHGVWSQINKQTGALEYVDMKTHNIVATFPNVEKNQMLEKHIAFTQASGKRTVCVLNSKGSKVDGIDWQHHYIDVQTKDEYIIRKIRQRFYYISLFSRLVIRETDISKALIQQGDGIYPEEMNRQIDVYNSKTEGFPEVSFPCRDCEFYN